MTYRNNTMSIRSSLLRGKGIFICRNNVLRFETKTNGVDVALSDVKMTVIYKNRGWIMCEDIVHTFKAPSTWSCPWSHHVLDGTEHRGGCVTGVMEAGFFIGDNKHARVSKTWEVACVQRLSRFSTTFDVVWLDISTPHAFTVTHVTDEKDDVCESVETRVENVFYLGADPYAWKQALRVAKKESWVLEDWLYVFTEEDEDEEEDDEDDDDWEPPAKQRRVDSESSLSDSDDEACAI